MADNQTEPGAVHITRASKFQRDDVVGPFGRSFTTLGDAETAAGGIKAVWRNEIGPFTSTHAKATER